MLCPRPAARISLTLFTLLLGCTGGGEGDDEVGETETGSETTETSETGTDQPMVVDVLVELAEPGFATLTHSDDPGVRVARLDGEGPATNVHFRVRGLAPDTNHDLELGLGSSRARRAKCTGSRS